jgi:hypothetical protein
MTSSQLSGTGFNSALPPRPASTSKAPWFWEYMQAVGPLLDGQPEVSMTTVVWGKGTSL